MNKIPTLAIVLVAIGLGSLVFSLTYTAYNTISYSAYGSQVNGLQGIMGNGMMGYPSFGGYGGMMNGPLSSIDNATFNSVNTPPTGVTVNQRANTVSINTRVAVTILIEAAPVWYPRSGDYWLVYGLVNPTILVKSGTALKFLFINMDNDTHVAAITTTPPPYPYMPMMTGMMNGNSWLAIGPMMPSVQSSTGVANPVYGDSSLSVTFPNAGTYWYPCVYPGHAEMGMYGEILVSD